MYELSYIKKYRSGLKELSITSITFLLMFALFSYIVFYDDYIPTHDGLFHFRMASLLSFNNWYIDIEWLPLTILRTNGVDHQWVWHWLIKPFTLINNEDNAIRIAIAFTAALVPAAFCYLGYVRKIPYPYIFAIAGTFLALNMPDRLLMLRAQNMAVIFILLYLYFFTIKQYFGIFSISFLFIAGYHAALIIVPIGAILVSIRWLLIKNLDSKAIIATLSGLCLGLILNPWFPDNIEFIFFHFLYKVMNPAEGSMGVEWISESYLNSIKIILPIMLLFSLSWLVYFISFRTNRKLTEECVLWASVATVFFLIIFISPRFSEYSTPIAAFSIGLLVRDIGINNKAIIKHTVLIISALTIFFGYTGLTRSATKNMDNPIKYQQIANYLDKNAEKGELVFNFFWSDFVNLFWHTRKVNLLSGLDGNFLRYENPNLYRYYNLLTNLSSRKIQNLPEPSLMICSVLSSRWVLIANSMDNDSRLLIKLLSASSYSSIAIKNEWGILFKLDCDAAKKYLFHKKSK